MAKFKPVCSPQIRSATIIQPNAMPKLKLPRLTRVQLLIILALPLLPRKCCSVTLESECVLPCNFRRPEEQSIKRHVGCSVYREHRCGNKCFVQSKQSHRRKRNREPFRIPKRKLVRLYCQSKKRKHLKLFLTKGSKVFRTSFGFCKKSEVKVVSANNASSFRVASLRGNRTLCELHRGRDCVTVTDL